MSKKPTHLLTLILSAALLIPVPAFAQSGKVKQGQSKVPIRTVADEVNEAEPPVSTTGQPARRTARKGNSLSPTAAIVIIAAVITVATIIAIKTRKDRVCGPLSGCPLF